MMRTLVVLAFFASAIPCRADFIPLTHWVELRPAQSVAHLVDPSVVLPIFTATPTGNFSHSLSATVDLNGESFNATAAIQLQEFPRRLVIRATNQNYEGERLSDHSINDSSMNFTLTAPARITFDSSLFAGISGLNQLEPVPDRIFGHSNSPGDFEFTGVLQPGKYELWHSSWNGVNVVSVSFANIVPEPSTLSLACFAGMTATLCRFRRRR